MALATRHLAACTLIGLAAIVRADPNHIEHHAPHRHPGDPINGTSPIVLDGRFGDWAGIAPAVLDPPDDARDLFDISHVYATSRGPSLYLRFNTGSTLNLQAGYEDEGSLVWTITGPTGASLSFDPRARTLYRDGNAAQTIPHAAARYIAMPTHAAEEFELHIDLSAIGVEAGQSVIISCEGSDTFQPFECALIDPLARVERLTIPGESHLRIANLNTFRAGVVDPARRDPMTRLLNAADADIYTFQELWDVPARDIAAAMNQMMPLESGQWRIVASGDGTAIASRIPIDPLPVPDTVRCSLGVIRSGAGRPLVVGSIHLKCCGFASSPEDRQRIAEMRDLMDYLNEFVSTYPGDDHPATVLAGDWNLVGSRTPLDLATGDRDPINPFAAYHWHIDDSGAPFHATWEDCDLGPGYDAPRLELAALDLRHFDAVSTCTWRDATSSFPPGRLDYIALGGGWLDLAPATGWIFDTRSMTEGELAALGLQPGDSSVSDHLMLVVDLPPPPVTHGP